jgi:hypothetical protein
MLLTGHTTENNSSKSSSESDNDDYLDLQEQRTEAETQRGFNKDENKSWTKARKRSDYDMSLKAANKTLYEGVDVTLITAAVILMKFIHYQNMSYKAIKMAIGMVKLFVPKKFRNYFKGVPAFIDKHFLRPFAPQKYFFCSSCYKLLEEAREKKQSCDSCNRMASSGEFILAPVEKQLQAILRRKKIREMILNRKTDHNGSNISSLFDGLIYKAHQKFLDIKSNISLSYYADGVALYTSSKLSIWPFFLHINELPIEERYKIENTIILGLWYDKEKKPFFNTFLEPTIPFFDSFRTKGITIEFIENNKVCNFNLKGILIFGNGDAPARAIMLHFLQFNGHFGCSVCLQDPQTVEKILKQRAAKEADEGKASKRMKHSEPLASGEVKAPKNLVYEYKKDITLRTSKDTLKLAYEAEEEKKSKSGVKGVSILSIIVWKYFVESMGLDTMHSVFSGIGKKLIELWFDKIHKDQKFSLFKFISVVDKYLEKIKHPNFCTRHTRPFTGHLSFYTTSELKNWLMYFSIPILQQIMTREYFEHYFFLVEAMFLLHQDSISQEDLIKADCLLHKFVSAFEKLYGLQYMSFNVHSLLHLPEVTKNLGPLSQLNCFPLEKLNGRIKNWVKGSRYPERRIISFLSAAQTMPSFVDQIPENSEELEFIYGMEKSYQACRLENIKDNIWALGKKYKPCDARSREFILEAFENSELAMGSGSLMSVELFQNLKVGKAIYTSKMNKAASESMSYCIEYGPNKNIGIVEFYAKIKICNCHTEACHCPNEFVAVINNCKKLAINSSIQVNSFINKLCIVRQLSAIRVTHVNYMCAYIPVHMDNNDTIYCIRRVNLCESE